MGVTKDATAQLVKMEQDGPAALHQVPMLSFHILCRACSCTVASNAVAHRGMVRCCRGEARAWEQARGSG